MNLKDRMTFEQVTFDDETSEVYAEVRRTVTSDTPRLPDIANEFYWFLVGCGFTYVTGVTIHTGDKTSVRSE